MKVLMLNGSPKPRGCTYTALTEIGRTLETEGIEYEIFQLGAGPIRDCIACRRCGEQGCIFDDDEVNEFLRKSVEADGFVFGTPVYYAHPSGRILSFLDRAFYSHGSSKTLSKAFRYKPVASVASARRAGTTASFDVMNKYFSITEMICVGSNYWNMVHGSKPEDVLQDEEGLQVMRNIAHNMAWILRLIEAGKAAGVELPKSEYGKRTDFIR